MHEDPVSGLTLCSLDRLSAGQTAPPAGLARGNRLHNLLPMAWDNLPIPKFLPALPKQLGKGTIAPANAQGLISSLMMMCIYRCTPEVQTAIQHRYCFCSAASTVKTAASSASSHRHACCSAIPQIHIQWKGTERSFQQRCMC